MCNEHVRYEAWLTTSANCLLPDMTSCTEIAVLTDLWYDFVYLMLHNSIQYIPYTLNLYVLPIQTVPVHTCGALLLPWY